MRVLTPPVEVEDADCQFPRVVRGADGVVYMSWVRKIGRRHHALQFSRFDGSRFAAARTIAEGRNWFVNWADFPSLAVAEGTFAAHWLERSGTGRYSYGVRVVCSMDEGVSWLTPFWLHEDRQPTEHGFATLVPAADGSFDAVWLDGRDLPRTGKMTLRSRRFDANGPKGAGVQLDNQVCECCATAAVRSAGKLIAVYRDNSEEGIRDISVVRQVEGVWSPIASCADDGWKKAG